MGCEGQAQEDYWYWKNEDDEAYCTKIQERIPGWHTERRKGTITIRSVGWSGGLAADLRVLDGRKGRLAPYSRLVLI